jgi:MFS family permease
MSGTDGEAKHRPTESGSGSEAADLRSGATGAVPIAAATALSAAGVLPVLLVGAESTFEQSSLGFSSNEIALCIAGFFMLASASSWASRRFHAQPEVIMRGGAAVIVCGSLSVLFSGSAAVLCVALAAAGITYGGTQPAVSAYLATYVRSQRQGLAFGLRQTAVPAATILSGLAVAFVAHTTWERAYIAPAILAVTSATFLRRGPHNASARPRVANRNIDVERNGLVLIAIGLGLGAAAVFTLSTFSVPYSISRGLGAGSAGVLVAVGGVAGLIVRLFVGWESDRHRFNKLRVSGAMLLLGACCYAGVAFGSSVVLVIATVGAFAAGAGWNGLVIHTLVQAFPRRAAHATGAALTAAYFGGAIGPLLFSALAHVSGDSIAWSCIVLLAVAAAVLMLVGAHTVRIDVT